MPGLGAPFYLNSGSVFPSNWLLINEEVMFGSNNYGVGNEDAGVFVVEQVIILIQPDVLQVERGYLVPI